MPKSITQRAREYHEALPGIIRATINDAGITNEIIDKRELGWNGRHITVPIKNTYGVISLIEEWSPNEMGVAVDPSPITELYPHSMIAAHPYRLVIAEGIYEALVLESQGFAAVAASGTGRYWKIREWTELVQGVPEIAIAFKAGSNYEPEKHKLNRREVVERIRESLPHAQVIEWPSVVPDGFGAAYFFNELDRSADEFASLCGWR